MSNNKNLIEKVEYRGELRIVGTIYEYYGDKKLDHVGYVVMVEKTRQFKAYTVMQTFALLERFKFINAELATYNGMRNIKCTDSSENRLPIFDTNLNIRDNQGIYILGEIRYDYKKVGFRCMDTSGKVVDLQESQLIHMVESNGTKIINGKYVHKKDSTGYISGISSDFLKIELSKKPDEKSEKLTKEKKWLYEKHTAKWLNKILPGVISYYTAADRYRQLNSKAYCNMGGDKQYKPVLAVNRENRIIVKEVLVESNGIKLTDKDKEIIKKYLDKFNEENVNKERVFIDNIIYLAQFVLKNKEIKNNIYNKLSRRISIGTYRGYSNPIPIGLLNLADSPDFKDMASSELVKLIRYAKKVAKEYKSDLDKINYQRDKKIILGKFNSNSFISEEDFNRLGYTIDSEKEDKIITTPDGSKYTLKNLRKYIPNFDKYNEKSRCLGDLISIAAVNKIIHGGYRRLEGVNNVYNVAEVIIATSFLFESQAMLDYVTDFKDKLHAVGIIGYDENKFKELAYTDYKLDAIIRLYYASGFNVFRCTNEALRKRGKNIVKKDNLINYKTFNSKFEIYDDLLMVDLASIITLVTSENCDSSDIEHVIGRMRFI